MTGTRMNESTRIDKKMLRARLLRPVASSPVGAGLAMTLQISMYKLQSALDGTRIVNWDSCYLSIRGICVQGFIYVNLNKV